MKYQSPGVSVWESGGCGVGRPEEPIIVKLWLRREWSPCPKTGMPIWHGPGIKPPLRGPNNFYVRMKVKLWLKKREV